MRRPDPAWLLVLLGLLAPLLRAQRFPDDALLPLQSGDLVLWFVGQGTTPAPAAPPAFTQYREQTAGTFGTASSNIGQTAGSFGTAASNLSTHPAARSRASSDLGQTAGSLGTASSNIGQTAGSFGQAVSTLGAPTAVAPPTGFAWLTLSRFDGSTGRQHLSPVWSTTLSRVDGAFPDLRLRAAFVPPEELSQDLAAAQGTPDFPDLLLGSPLPPRSASSPELLSLTLASLGVPLAEDDAMSSFLPSHGDALILRHASHPDQARAFVLWLRHRECPDCVPHPVSPAATAPAQVAASAVTALLQGAGILPYADPSFAEVSPALARNEAFSNPAAEDLSGLQLRSEVIFSSANDRLAVIGLRITASSSGGFGVLYPLVVLRPGEGGRWRVLQLSLTLSGTQLLRASAALGLFTRAYDPAHVHRVTAITPASPVDGDARANSFDLWWDNPGDANLLLVEWQPDHGSTRLALVPDPQMHLQTRVPATFLQAPGAYRWRVWSVGYGGVLALGPWRRLTVLP